jgi:hypothetical protein
MEESNERLGLGQHWTRRAYNTKDAYNTEANGDNYDTQEDYTNGYEQWQH